jgi:hypothetical protein
VREDILRRSAACTSVSNFSSSMSPFGIAIAIVPELHDGATMLILSPRE